MESDEDLHKNKIRLTYDAQVIVQQLFYFLFSLLRVSGVLMVCDMKYNKHNNHSRDEWEIL